MDVHIRKAKSGDMEAVHALVRQLAAFERAPEAVITTTEQFREDLARGRFEVLLAEIPGNPEGMRVVGIAFYYTAYSTWKGPFLWLDDLVVDAEFRHRGIGSLLFDAVVAECRERSFHMLKWQVLDWNIPAIRFYTKYKAVHDGEWQTWRLTFD